jgi:hypothetical protein
MNLLSEFGFGEMWARNHSNIRAVRGSSIGGIGLYILYNGSTPVYVGKGNIRTRLEKAHKSRRRGKSWDHFSWYLIEDKGLTHDVEILLIRTLKPFLRLLNQQCGHFQGVHSTDRKEEEQRPHYIDRTELIK